MSPVCMSAAVLPHAVPGADNNSLIVTSAASGLFMTTRRGHQNRGQRESSSLAGSGNTVILSNSVLLGQVPAPAWHRHRLIQQHREVSAPQYIVEQWRRRRLYWAGCSRPDRRAAIPCWMSAGRCSRISAPVEVGDWRQRFRPNHFLQQPIDRRKRRHPQQLHRVVCRLRSRGQLQQRDRHQWRPGVHDPPTLPFPHFSIPPSSQPLSTNLPPHNFPFPPLIFPSPPYHTILTFLTFPLSPPNILPIQSFPPHPLLPLPPPTTTTNLSSTLSPSSSFSNNLSPPPRPFSCGAPRVASFPSPSPCSGTLGGRRIMPSPPPR